MHAPGFFSTLSEVDRGEPYQIGDPMKTQLEDAIALASRMHYGDRDKCDEPYIMHCLRVMLKGNTYSQMIVGVLHDIVEDTPVTLDEIKLRFGDEIAFSVDCITHRKNETNEAYWLRVKEDLIARQVKVYDLEDNMSHDRMHALPADIRQRLTNKYNRAMEAITQNGPPVRRTF
jgi:(p)ppGpp synthase/HD superfamily hydrolase